MLTLFTDAYLHPQWVNNKHDQAIILSGSMIALLEVLSADPT